MNRSTRSFLSISTILLCFFVHVSSYAHNGKIAYARPLGKIKVDGTLSDWPVNSAKYPITYMLGGESKPKNAADFSGYFQVGYRLDTRSLYLAFTITDNDFLEDTSANVRFDSQDCFELCLDAQHLPFGSGVASFMYSKKLRNINKAFYDRFAKDASWDIMEVAETIKGNERIVEWRINLGNELAVGKSIGLDFQFFDKDADNTFSVTGWGKGGYKFQSPGNLGDIVIVPADQKLGTVSGNLSWESKGDFAMPGRIRFNSDTKKLAIDAEVDSTGKYSAEIPVGKYGLTIPDSILFKDVKAFSITSKTNSSVIVKAGQKTSSSIVISGSAIPDLIPEKGVLHDYNAETPKQIDEFVKSYQKIFGIPGVSLALIKDGKVIYHKVYGDKNAATHEKVDENTLFEAASVTKPVFSFAVQRLAERGIIDLDKPLYLYLPYPDIAHDDRYKLITARHVLTHRTGFPNWRSMNADGKLNIMFTPGTSYNYSGEGFEYLKLVVEKITGKKVEQVLKEEVIEPMGLYHTFFSGNDSLKAVKSNGHFDMMPTPVDMPDAPGMAWSMHTEAKIFTRFMLYMLEQKGLTQQTYDTMFSKHSEFKPDPGDALPRYPAYMGMSLEIRETPFGKSFGHGGNNGDFKCQFEVYKDLKAGYVIFTNSSTSYPFLEAMRDFLVDGKAKKD